jgi:hypothetical protein
MSPRPVFRPVFRCALPPLRQLSRKPPSAAVRIPDALQREVLQR